MKLKTFGAVLLVSTGIAVTPATAADFGGDCCADLEERIAELEATTARKGNRKVSLTVSGHVNEAVMFWDDGEESNVYVVGNEASRTRLRFRGKAKINSDWSAGYRLEIGFRTARSDRVDQNQDDTGQEIDLRHAAWFLKSKTYGSLTVGQTPGATEGITEATTGSTAGFKNGSDNEDQFAGFQLRTADGLSGALEWRRLVKDNFIQSGEGSRGNYVTYKSPTFAGFNFLASAGEDDVWEVALKYKGTVGDFKVKGGIGYSRNTDGGSPATSACLFNEDADNSDCEQFGGSLSAMHKPSGLFVAVSAGWFQDNNTFVDSDFSNRTFADDEHTFWAVQAGITTKINSLGNTTLWVDYFDHDGGANDRSFEAGDALATTTGFANTGRILSSDVESIRVGIAQKIDAAAMELYAVYAHIEGDATFIEDDTDTQANVSFEDLDVVITGARIKF